MSDSRKAGWEIRQIERSERSAFMVTGVNHETDAPETFYWHVDSVTADRRYWLAPNAVITPEAAQELDKRGWPRKC